MLKKITRLFHPQPPPQSPFPWNSEEEMRRWLARTHSSNVWRMATGEYTTFSRMSTHHLVNCVRAVERSIAELLKASLHACAFANTLQGDIAQWSIEQDMFTLESEGDHLMNIAAYLQDEIDGRRTNR